MEQINRIKFKFFRNITVGQTLKVLDKSKRKKNLRGIVIFLIHLFTIKTGNFLVKMGKQETQKITKFR